MIRRPLVLIGGRLAELPQTDTLPGVGAPSVGVPVYMQQVDPAPGTPYIWFKTDADGNVIDILKG